MHGVRQQRGKSQRPLGLPIGAPMLSPGEGVLPLPLPRWLLLLPLVLLLPRLLLFLPPLLLLLLLLLLPLRSNIICTSSVGYAAKKRELSALKGGGRGTNSTRIRKATQASEAGKQSKAKQRDIGSGVRTGSAPMSRNRRG